MDYSKAIKESVKYIDEQIGEDLNAEKIALHVGYSVYHFCRIFALSQGIPLMDYVRKRRMLLAKEALTKENKVIEVALQYGFDTASGFSKAFRKEFGYNPTTFIKRMSIISPAVTINYGGVKMNPIIVKKDEFKVAGYGIKTNIAQGYTKDIAAYWDQYNGENLESKMYKQLDPPKHGEVGVCITEEDESVLYLLGVIVDNFDKVTADMITTIIPKATYAVFTTLPVTQTKETTADPLSIAVKETWKYIFDEWLPNSNYEFDETKVDFEFYDERCHELEGAVMEIYVPIIPKKSDNS